MKPAAGNVQRFPWRQSYAQDLRQSCQWVLFVVSIAKINFAAVQAAMDFPRVQPLTFIGSTKIDFLGSNELTKKIVDEIPVQVGTSASASDPQLCPIEAELG